MTTKLTEREIRKLQELAQCLEKWDLQKLHILTVHADTIDDVLKTANAFGVAGRYIRTLLIWVAGLIVAFSTVNLAFKGTLQKWLGT